jgi:putative transposase
MRASRYSWGAPANSVGRGVKANDVTVGDNADPVTRAALERTKTVAPATITRAYRYALDPTPRQVNLMCSHFGGTRFAYNALLGLVKANWDENRARKEAGEVVVRENYLGTSHFDLQKLWYERRDELAPWWAVNNSSTYNYACLNLSKAFANWQKGQARFPTFKKRGSKGSVSLMPGALKLVDSHHVRISRVGVLKTYESTRKMNRHLERGTGRILSATLVDVGGRFSISFTLEVTRSIPATRAPEKVIGVDVGISTLYTGATPSGEKVLLVENSRHYVRAEKKLAWSQRLASRCQGPGPGKIPSKRWKKANCRVQKVHAEIANTRRNLIHETTTMLAKSYDVIVPEDLNVKGMLKNHSLAKHISDAAWSEFRRQLEYKTTWYGSTLVVAERFYPSSKTCSRCGTVKAKLSLDERMFQCEACGLTIDRDVNAAINLARLGLAGASSGTGRGGEVSPRQQILAVEAHPGEASTKASTVISA